MDKVPIAMKRNVKCIVHMNLYDITIINACMLQVRPLITCVKPSELLYTGQTQEEGNRMTKIPAIVLLIVYGNCCNDNFFLLNYLVSTTQIYM